MNHLIVDEQVLADLSRLRELTEVRGAGTYVVGYFVPMSVRKARMWAEAPGHVDTVDILNGKSSHHHSYTMRQVFEHILRQAPDERGTGELRQAIEERKAEEAAETFDPPPDADPPLQADGPA